MRSSIVVGPSAPALESLEDVSGSMGRIRRQGTLHCAEPPHQLPCGLGEGNRSDAVKLAARSSPSTGAWGDERLSPGCHLNGGSGVVPRRLRGPGRRRRRVPVARERGRASAVSRSRGRRSALVERGSGRRDGRGERRGGDGENDRAGAAPSHLGGQGLRVADHPSAMRPPGWRDPRHQPSRVRIRPASPQNAPRHQPDGEERQDCSKAAGPTSHERAPGPQARGRSRFRSLRKWRSVAGLRRGLAARRRALEGS